MDPGEIALSDCNHALEARREHPRDVLEHLAIDAHRPLLELAVGLRIARHQARRDQQRGDSKAPGGHQDLMQGQVRHIALPAHRGVPARHRLVRLGVAVEARGEFTRQPQLHVARIQCAAFDVAPQHLRRPRSRS